MTSRNDEAILAKLNRNIDTSGGPDACWPWLRATQHGYGIISIRGRSAKAHRIAYQFWVEPISAATIDHECHNRAYARGECAGGNECPHRRCCNPAHLVPRSIGENTLRGAGPSAINARKIECDHGHPLDTDRTCPECDRAASERYRLSKIGQRKTCTICGRSVNTNGWWFHEQKCTE